MKHKKTKFVKPDYQLPFVESIINIFQSTMHVEDLFIIQLSLFAKDTPLTLIDIPFCEKTKYKSNDFIKKFHHLTNGKYISIHCIRNKVKRLFPLKHNNIYLACNIYYHVLS